MTLFLSMHHQQYTLSLCLPPPSPPFKQKDIHTAVTVSAQTFSEEYIPRFKKTCTFAAMKVTTRRQSIASWVLLAIYVSMLLIASLHVHERPLGSGEECAECIAHHCHGHLSQTATWAHDCVLCQFLSQTMLPATVIAVGLFVEIVSERLAGTVEDSRVACYAVIVTRGPPSC